MKPLKDKVILITGAGGGLGSTAALTLAKSGAHIILLDKNIAKLEVVYDAILATDFFPNFNNNFDTSFNTNNNIMPPVTNSPLNLAPDTNLTPDTFNTTNFNISLTSITSIGATDFFPNFNNNFDTNYYRS